MLITFLKRCDIVVVFTSDSELHIDILLAALVDFCFCGEVVIEIADLKRKYPSRYFLFRSAISKEKVPECVIKQISIYLSVLISICS